jgi:hypothetical protein
MVHLWVHKKQSLNIPLPLLHLMLVICKRRRGGHAIDKCKKLTKQNEKNKEIGMSIVENTSNAKNDEANVAQDVWVCHRL